MKATTLAYLALALSAASCGSRQQADAVYYNARVYTVDSSFSIAEAFAVKDGKILKTGTSREILEAFNAEDKVDLSGKFVYPGLIDPHSHFYAYGTSLDRVSLEGTRSWQEVLERVQDFAKEHGEGWILGRGWDQNDWEVKQFPDKRALDSLFSRTPVLLQRVDGHAAVANQAALDQAGITAASVIKGGEFVKKDGKLTGVLVDNAMELVEKKIPLPGAREVARALAAAEKNCFAAGLTSVSDAGLDRNIIQIMDSLHKSRALRMRVYAMVNPSAENKAHYFKTGKYRTERLNVSSFKIYADGALGSRGACLLKPYSDKPDHTGFLLQDREYFRQTAKEIAASGFQMNTHCIGDSSNRYILDVYGEVLGGRNDRRWRIEHAQVVAPGDFEKFGKYSIIPSIQPTHATSDMYWAGERVGDRIKGAYAYKQLLREAGIVANGSDFPVESINPLYGFYAAVARKDQKNYPAEGFLRENALSREEALRAMTIWAAYAAFEEKEKGSLEPGKFADFVVLDNDLMQAPEESLWKIKVLRTYSNGEKVHETK